MMKATIKLIDRLSVTLAFEQVEIRQTEVTEILLNDRETRTGLVQQAEKEFCNKSTKSANRTYSIVLLIVLQFIMFASTFKCLSTVPVGRFISEYSYQLEMMKATIKLIDRLSVT